MVVFTVLVNGSAASSHTRSSSSSAGDRPAVGGEQAFQHGEFLGGQRQAPPGADRDAPGRVEAQVAVLEAGGQRGRGAPARARMRATSSAKSNGLGR